MLAVSYELTRAQQAAAPQQPTQLGGSYSALDARRQKLVDEGDPQPEYGKAFGMNVRFKTKGGEAPVLRMLWVKDPVAWRITTYGIESP